MNILVPMAGLSRSFIRSKFKVPKYLVEIDGETLLKRSLHGLTPGVLKVENLHYYFIVRKEVFCDFGLCKIIQSIIPAATILTVDFSTDGQACTALWAESRVGNDDPLIIMGPDQILDWDPDTFVAYAEETGVDACVVVADDLLSGVSPFRVSVTDKYKITGIYTKKKSNARYYDCGVYYFKYGWYFPLFCKSMITRNARVDNEFHLSMIINDAIVQRKDVSAYQISNAAIFRKPRDIRDFAKKTPQWMK